MSCKTLLAPLLMAFGFVLGAPALGDDVSSDSGAATGVWIDAIVVGAPSNDMTLCLRLNSGCANLPCVISADGATLACVTLAPGDSRDVTVTLKSAPQGYQYGALEVIGLPTDIAKRKGIVTGYRLVGALRYKPAVPTYEIGTHQGLPFFSMRLIPGGNLAGRPSLRRAVASTSR